MSPNTPQYDYWMRDSQQKQIGAGLKSQNAGERAQAWGQLQAAHRPQRQMMPQPPQQQPQQQQGGQQFGPQQWMQMGGWMQNQFMQQQQQQQQQPQQRARPWFFAPRQFQAPQQFVPQQQQQFRPQPSRALAEQLGLFGRGMRESMNAARGY